MEKDTKIFHSDIINASDENKTIRVFYDDKNNVISLVSKKGNSFDIPYDILPDVSRALVGCVGFTHDLVIKNFEK